MSLTPLCACPVMSFFKASPVQCLSSTCAWWLPKNGQEGNCALFVMAHFFQERAFPPSKN